MGKNPNAKKLKEKKHRERTYSNNIEDLEEEASRQGISVEELQKKNKAEQAGSDSDEGSSSEEEQQPKKQQKKPLKKI